MVCPREAELVTDDSTKGGRGSASALVTVRSARDDKGAASLVQSVTCRLCASELQTTDHERRETILPALKREIGARRAAAL